MKRSDADIRKPDAGLRLDITLDQQILTCPVEWLPVYRAYMDKKKIEYREETDENGQVWFVIARCYKPHQWKLKAPGE